MSLNLTDINTIKALLGEEGFRFSKAKGQNFLKEHWVVEQTSDAGCLGEDCGVLEIGPGIGCLTAELSLRSGKVVAVEIDETLKPVLNRTMSDYPNVTIVYGDIMKENLNTLIEDHFNGFERLSVCANLPYNITTPVLTKLVESQLFEMVTVMIQKEVAERICANPASGEWGAFSVLMQWYCETEMLYNVPPSCFIPAPKVISSVVQLRRRNTVPAQCCNTQLMFRIVRAVFNQRRKTMVNAVSNSLGGCMTKDMILQTLEEMGKSPTVRGETFSIKDFAEFTNIISNKIKEV